MNDHLSSPTIISMEALRTAGVRQCHYVRRILGDNGTREQIVCAPGPHAAKQIGRRVKGFDEIDSALTPESEN